jgi:hypothetical protein
MPTSNDEGEALVVKQIAEFLKVTERTLYRLAVAENLRVQGWWGVAILQG